MDIEQLEYLFENAYVIEIIGIIFLFNMTITLTEIVYDYFASSKRNWKDTFANISIFGFASILEGTIYGMLGIIALLPFYYLTPFEIPMNIYTWIIAFILADLTYYWLHRTEHEHRILWAVHSVHHSSQDYNLTVANRLSILETIVEWIFLIPMVLIGFNLFQTIICLILVAQYQHWIHNEKIKKLGIFDEIFNSPSNHRVHHGSNKKYIDKNYGGVFMIWDKMFGTFQREDKKVVYGLTKNINTNNPIKITFIEFKNIYNDVKKCRTFRDSLKIIFGSLDWKPKYFSSKK